MALLTFAKVYGIGNTSVGRMLAREIAEGFLEEIREKLGNRTVFGAQILFDERCAEEPGFRIKMVCRSAAALAAAMDLPLADGSRRGRTAGGRDAFTIDLCGAPSEMVEPAPTAAPVQAAPVEPAPVVAVVEATPEPVAEVQPQLFGVMGVDY